MFFFFIYIFLQLTRALHREARGSFKGNLNDCGRECFGPEKTDFEIITLSVDLLQRLRLTFFFFLSFLFLPPRSAQDFQNNTK